MCIRDSKNGFLTNAGNLMTDQHTVYNSRMFCTRWNGLEQGSIFDDALDDKEYEGNLIYLQMCIRDRFMDILAHQTLQPIHLPVRYKRLS